MVDCFQELSSQSFIFQYYLKVPKTYFKKWVVAGWVGWCSLWRDCVGKIGINWVVSFARLLGELWLMELCAVASWEKTSQGRRSHHASAPGLLPAYFSLQFLAVVQHLVVLSSFLFWYFVKIVNILLNTFIFIIQTACPLSTDLSQNATYQLNTDSVILLELNLDFLLGTLLLVVITLVV